MIESSSVAFKRSPSAETTLDVFGVDVMFLVEGAHTGGGFGMLEYVSKPGHEPPPHRHEHEDEVFYIVEGGLEMHCGDIQPSGAEQALKILGVPKDGRHGRAGGSTYASAMLDPANPLKVAAQFGVHNLSREEIAVSMPQFPLASR